MSLAVAGGGQVTWRTGPDDALEPVDLMAEAARRAADDAGAGRSLLRAVDVVAVVNILSWRHPDPGSVLAARLGIDGARTLQSTIGGNSPQLLVNELAREMAAGTIRVALVAGAEAMYTRRRSPRPLPWLPAETAASPAPFVGDARPGSSDDEAAHQAAIPAHVYPLFEAALRARTGLEPAVHRRALGELWAAFSDVSAGNPHAWSQRSYTPAEISDPGPGNRMVTFPYTKRMCANIDVDQGAALLLCTPEAAREAGVPDDRLVFLHAGTDVSDHFFVTQRWSLADSPGLAAAGRDALAACGLGVDDIARFDLYSCFPSAVQIAADALGLPGFTQADPRPLTVTGGLSFAGGPGSNYVTHAIASMVAACRHDPGSFGLVNGVGWYLTKHSVGVYSTRRPAPGTIRVDPATTQAAVDALPRREPAGPHVGRASVEATAVHHNRDGSPALAILTALTPDGRRALANSTDPSVLASMVDEEWVGRDVRLRTDGRTNTLDA